MVTFMYIFAHPSSLHRKRQVIKPVAIQNGGDMARARLRNDSGNPAVVGHIPNQCKSVHKKRVLLLQPFKPCIGVIETLFNYFSKIALFLIGFTTQRLRHKRTARQRQKQGRGNPRRTKYHAHHHYLITHRNEWRDAGENLAGHHARQ